MVHLDADSLRGKEDVYQWYTAEINSIPPAMQELMEKHSGLAPDRVVPHISEVRDRAFHTWPYPCIGQLRFLNLNLSNNPHYSEILNRLKTQGQTLLDAGCCFGQDLRKLAFDGVPASSLYGMDVEGSFFDLGFDLFLDREKLAGATFVSGDLLKKDEPFPQFEGAIDIIHASSLLHLFTWNEQVQVATRLAGFTKAKPGSIIIGRQVGAEKAGEYRGLNEGSTSYRHNVESFERLWAEVGAKTGSKWKVDAKLDMQDIVKGVNLGQSWMEPGTKRLHFVVTREAPSVSPGRIASPSL